MTFSVLGSQFLVSKYSRAGFAPVNPGSQIVLIAWHLLLLFIPADSFPAQHETGKTGRGHQQKIYFYVVLNSRALNTSFTDGAGSKKNDQNTFVEEEFFF